MAEDGFPLPGSSYKELCKIIAAYSEVSGPCSPDDVSKLIGIHSTQVSRSNKFLLAISVVEGGQKKKPTSFGTKLGRAIHFDQTEAIQQAWREVYLSTSFLQKIVSSIRIRKGMDETALTSHIAFTSGNSKGGFAMAGAGAIIEILRISGAIQEDGGTLIAAELSHDDPAVGLEIVHIPKDKESNHSRKLEPTFTQDRPVSSSVIGLLNLNITIACTPDQLEGLGSKLRTLRQEFEGTANVDLKIAPEGAEGLDDEQPSNP